MLQKNIDKQNRKNRKMWNGLAPKQEPTKKQKLEKMRKKFKKPLDIQQEK